MAAGIFGLVFYIFGLVLSLFVGMIRRIYCWFMYRYILYNYDKRVESYKLELFADLEDVKDGSTLYPVTPVVQQSRSPRKKQGVKEDKFTVLEIGVGWGGNFRFFPEGSSVVAVEPHFPKERFEEYLAMIHSHDHGVEIGKVVATEPEDMGQIDTESVDVVVCTRVLSSVRRVDDVLQEIRRVLKTVGHFIKVMFRED